MTGSIKHLAPTYGFIRPDRYVASDRATVFFHRTAVEGVLDFAKLAVGDRVDLELEEPVSLTRPKAARVAWIGRPQPDLSAGNPEEVST